MFILHTLIHNEQCREFEFPYVLVSEELTDNLPNTPLDSYCSPDDDKNDTKYKAQRLLKELDSLSGVRFEYIDFLERKVRMKIIATGVEYSEAWEEVVHAFVVSYFMPVMFESTVKRYSGNGTKKRLKKLAG